MINPGDKLTEAGDLQVSVRQYKFVWTIKDRNFTRASRAPPFSQKN